MLQDREVRDIWGELGLEEMHEYCDDIMSGGSQEGAQSDSDYVEDSTGSQYRSHRPDHMSPRAVSSPTPPPPHMPPEAAPTQATPPAPKRRCGKTELL